MSQLQDMLAVHGKAKRLPELQPVQAFRRKVRPLLARECKTMTPAEIKMLARELAREMIRQQTDRDVARFDTLDINELKRQQHQKLMADRKARQSK